MKIYSLKKKSIPKLAVLATGLAAALLAVTISPKAAQAFPSKGTGCTGCHTAGGSVTATPSTASVAPSAAYTVVLAFTGGSTPVGYAITGNGANVNASDAGPASMTAPAAVGSYTYTVWMRSGVVVTTTYSITVGSAPTTVPPTTIPPTTIPPTTVPPVTSAAIISALSLRHGAVGTIVTLSGSGFGTLGSVQFGKTVTTAKTWTDTTIVFEVPAGTHARVAHVRVIPGGDTASNAVSFRFDKGHRSHDSFGDHHSHRGMDHRAFCGGDND